MAGAKVRNPRKRFLWQITFVKHPINSFLFQRVTLPEINVEKVAHGDINRDVYTGGRHSVGNMTLEKLETTSGSDTWIWDWMLSVQDPILGGGLPPEEYWETLRVDELAEDGTSIINSYIVREAWPTRLNGKELDRMVSDNTIDSIELSVGTCDKI